MLQCNGFTEAIVVVQDSAKTEVLRSVAPPPRSAAPPLVQDPRATRPDDPPGGGGGAGPGGAGHGGLSQEGEDLQDVMDDVQAPCCRWETD